MLEQLQNLNETMTTNGSFDLVGKYVYIEDSASTDSNVIFGKVNGVVKQDGIDYILVGDKTYSASDVVGVVDASSVEGDLDENVLQSSNLIGKTVTAVLTDDEGNETTVAGIVEKITIVDGVLYAYVDGQKIELSDITEISSGDTDNN
jgi:flagellar hook assembly protein FlgD